MKRIESFICTVTCLLLVFSSCIKEDLTNCPLPLQVVFSYENDNTFAQDDLQEATLFIFDENHKLVTSWSLSNPVLNTVYTPGIELTPQNNYSFVVWFNLLPPYTYTPDFKSVEGSPAEEDMAFRLQVPTATLDIGEPDFFLPVSLYGRTEDVISSEGVHTVVIPVKQNTNIINVSVHGLPPTTDSYLVSIQDDNGNYNFYNEFLPCEKFTYTEAVTFPPESEILNASLTVLRLAGNHPNPVLTIRNANTGNMIFPNKEGIQTNLIQLILAAYPQNDFDRTHVYNIEIFFTADMGITIKVNGWNVTESNDEIMPD
jgi:hypothetical protein